LTADSAYRTGELALAPRVGWLAGLVGSAFMLGVLRALRPIGDTALTAVLAWITGKSVLNLLLYFGLGGLWGLLYALCEQNGPKHALIAVGLAYGFALWVFGGLVGGAILGQSARSILHSWPLLLLCLAFGFWLAVVAVWSASHHLASTGAARD
jgi:hypothetical protein